MKRFFTALAISAALLAGAAAARADDLKIALIYGRTGPLEAYAKQTETGLRLGFEYATKGTMEVDGRKIVIIAKDDQGKPDLAKSALAEAYEDDGADIAIGTTSSAAAIAMLPVAEEHKKILIVEPAVADQITGDKWNRYIFRTAPQFLAGRDLQRGRDRQAGRRMSRRWRRTTPSAATASPRSRQALAKTGATLVAEEYAPANTTDFTAVGAAPVRRAEGQARPQDHLGRSGPAPAIRSTSSPTSTPAATASSFRPGGNILPALAAYKRFPGLEGAAYYYYDIPKNPVNDWLVAEHKKRFNAPPDFFTAGGFAAAMAVVAAVEKAKSTDTEKLIAAMEGMEFDTPKGKMIFRKEDHQALQSMYRLQDQGRSRTSPGRSPSCRAKSRSRTWTFRSATSGEAAALDARRPLARNARPDDPLRRPCRGRFGVSCAFRPGELTAIVGPNGAGKTTYFNLMSGQLRATGGAVLVDGATSRGLARRSARGSGSGARSSSPICFPASAWSRTCGSRRRRRAGVHYDMTRPWTARRDLIDRADAVLDDGRPCRRARRSAPPRCRTATSASSRSR